MALSSPPTRGCSAAFMNAEPDTAVLPADAGVFRILISLGFSSVRPPRRREGVPAWHPLGKDVDWSSPPTRGCSANRFIDLGMRAVLPADAGVFRPTDLRRPR